ncbi:GAF domain-containing protein [candidate division KSB1 bacterium]|nr:MAG: GAF domain-containing protein [candidate division KSB1 bacterium]
MEPAQKPAEAKLDHKSVELKSLFELSQILNSSLDVSRVLNNCLLTPMGRMLISRGMALAIDENGGYSIKVVKGIPGDLKDSKIYLEQHFVQPVLIEMLSDQCPNRDFFLSKGLNLLVPIISSNRMVGLLCLGPKMSSQKFSKNELEFLNSLSNLAATSIENALMFTRLETVNRQLDKKVQELKTLFEIGKELNSTLDLGKIYNIFLFTIMGEMAVNKLLLFLERGDKLTLAANRGVNDSSPLFQTLIEPDMLDYLSKHRTPFHISRDNSDKHVHILYKAGFQAVLPMGIQEETKGILLLGPKMSSSPYSDDDLEFLSTLGNRVMISIENARLFEETLEKQRLEEEIAIARDIQKRLLPSRFPQYDSLEIYGLNIPSRQVGGDFFDCIELDGQRIALAIGDVSGKGVGASLLMSNLHAGLHTLIDSNIDIHSLIGRLNNLIYENTNADKFITFFYAEYDLKTGRFTYVNAGHNPPYLYHGDGSFELLEKGGLLLGMLPNMIYEMGYVTLVPGDFIMTFTDGVTEAKDIAGEMFEEERLEKLITNFVTKKASVEDFANSLVKELFNFSKGVPQADDITLLGLRVKEHA